MNSVLWWKRKSGINHILWMYLIFGCEDDSSTLTHKERYTSAVTWNVYGVSKIRQHAGITRDSSKLWCVDLPESISTRKAIQTHVIKIHWILPYFNTLELQPFSPFYALFSYIQHVVCSAWAKVLCFFFNFIYWYSYFAGAPGVITGITLGVTYPDKYRLHNM